MVIYPKCFCTRKKKIITEDEYVRCIYCMNQGDTCKTSTYIYANTVNEWKKNMAKLIREYKLERILK